ncbi:DUF499 domain-containing protein [Methylomonas sp. MO1]|uniref:DUF499 domain-containing protein n=1 Tax=Methylomonas sp. MO1 TaxID=3073619 RepID=UPI0028A390F8|nr:DUF499 domain-containing protein [Methylomonas sp. MO1]MDT4292341.1 DUF499 domain-containing protein [Methylomonas sp. MO1]
MNLSQACKPRQSVFDRSRRDVVLNIDDLLKERINGEQFFDENFITSGMQILLDKVFERLAGRSNQASTFLLSQAMGGGKTHNMIALGLLAKNPEFRNKVLGTDSHGSRLGAIRVIGFNGRESDAAFGIWGELAEQLGKKEVFRDLYSPLSAPGTTAWINLLKGEPTIIFLDELPPYFANAKAKEIGETTLAHVTNTALSNLMVAVDRPELANVCVVISDLRATYEDGSNELNQALDNLANEANRSSLRLEPVNPQGDELYHILRTRLFSKVADEDVVREIAQDYAEAVRKAKQMDITNASPESFAAQLTESYPFHFSIRDLYARFKENPGFQQTRGLIRLMRVIVADMYTANNKGVIRADQVKLVHPYDFNLNNEEIQSEIRAINPSLTEAITHDIAKDGHSIAEELDIRLGTTDDAQDVAKLILVASLAAIPGATHGLRDSDIVSFLCAPGRDISAVKKNVIDYLPTQAWYLHRSVDGRLFFKNIQNLAAKLHSQANSYNEESCLKELRNYLAGLFTPHSRDCYQDMRVLPSLDEVELKMDRVSLIITQPATNPVQNSKLSEEWQKFFDSADFKNRVMFLTGSHRSMGRLLEQTRQYKAITDIIAEFNAERMASSDQQYRDAENSKDKITLSLRSALQETFTTLVYPGRDNALRVTDYRIHFENNQFDGEKLIRDTLEQKGKFTTDVSSDTFRKKVEARLFRNQQKSHWNEVLRAAATNTEWNFHDPKALDALKSKMLDMAAWVDDGGIINREPPKPETQVNVQVLSRNPDTGEANLKITPVNGDKVLYEIGHTQPSSASLDVAETEGGYSRFTTTDMHVSFLCVDSRGVHEQGGVYVWENALQLKHEVIQQGEDWLVELKAVPGGAEIRYTTDGSDPSTLGAVYEGEFEVASSCRYVQAIASKDGIKSRLEKIDMDQYREKKVVIDPTKPLTWNTRNLRNLSAKAAFDFIERLIKFEGIAQGVIIDVFANDESASINYSAEGSAKYSGEDIKAILEKLQGVMKGSQVSISVEEVKFQRGQQLIDWLAEIGRQLQPGEVRQ